MAKKSHDRDWFSLARLNNFFRGRDLSSLNNQDVADYIKSRKDEVATATISKEIALIRTALNWAIDDKGWRVSNPFRKKKLGSRVAHPLDHHRRGAARLLDAATGEPKSPQLVYF